jgi:hypothetical protein
MRAGHGLSTILDDWTTIFGGFGLGSTEKIFFSLGGKIFILYIRSFSFFVVQLLFLSAIVS